MNPFGTVYDPAWDLRAYSGWSPSMQGIIIAFRCCLVLLLVSEIWQLDLRGHC